MTTGCNQIDQVIKLADQAGNPIFHLPEDRDENDKLVAWMYDPLTNELKAKIDALNLKLEYWTFKGVPHNPGASGYTCNDCNVVVAFPDTKTPRIKSQQ